MTVDALAMTFLAARSLPSLPTLALGARLAEAAQAGRSRWPGVELADEVFAGHLARLVDDEVEVEQALARLQLADLYLVCACLSNVPRAIATFDEQLMSKVPTYIARIGTERDFADEVTQRLRIKLLVSDGEKPPRLMQYSGRGALESWVCAAAIRLALDLRRGPAAAAVEDVAELPLAAGNDVELEYLRTRYAEQFRQATAQALAALSPRDRNLLRFYYLERMTLDKLGAMYRVHATTVMRWLAEARESIVEEARRRLRAAVDVSDSEFQQVVELMRSNLDVSVRRLIDSSSSSK